MSISTSFGKGTETNRGPVFFPIAGGLQVLISLTIALMVGVLVLSAWKLFMVVSSS